MDPIPRPPNLARRMISLMSVSMAALLLVGLATPAQAASSIDPSATATEIAQAIDATGAEGALSGAAFEEVPPVGTPTAVATADPALASFPTHGASFGILTTGDARLADDPNNSPSSGANNNGPTPEGRGDSAFDVAILRVDLAIPEWASCLRIDFRFLSEEFPEFVGTNFNDAFIAELDPSTDPEAPANRRRWSTSGSEIMAPANFAFDPDGNPISINSSGFAHMTADEATGTTYDGATPLLAAQTPVTPGSHSVHLSIFDQGDHVYDSAVFLDKLSLGTQTGEGCQAGAQPLANLSLSVSPTSAPAGFDSMPENAMDYSSLSSVEDGAGATLATAPISRGPISRGPISRGPISRGPISRGPISRGGIVDADPGFIYAPLSLLPLMHVDPIPITQVPMVEPPGPWSAVLPPELAALPSQAVTVQRFAETTAASAVHVADLDLADSQMASLSPASLLLGNATIAELGVGSSNQPLALFEAQGGSVASLGVAGITLADRSGQLADSLLSGMALRGIEWENTDGWNVAVSDLPAAAQAAILECPAGGCGTETLGQARGNDHLRPDATVADLLSNLGGSSVLHGKSFGQLLPGILDVQNFPFESVPLSEILDAAPIDPTNLVEYEAAADVPCPMPDPETPAAFTVTLPGHGFRYAPGTADLRVGDSGSPVLREPSISGPNLTWEVTNEEACAGATGSQRVTIRFKVEPGPELGTFPSSLSVTAGTTLSILDQAPLTTTENFENNDSPQTAVPIAVDTLYTDTVAERGDTEFFRLGGFEGSDVGRTLQVALSHMPGQDYDVVLYGSESEASSTLRGAPISRGPISRGPISRGPLLDDAQCAPAGTVLEPQTMHDVHQVNEEGFEVRSYSTNRSIGNEFACTVIRPTDIGEGKAFTIQVTGYNDAASASPAVLSAEMSAPVTPLQCVPVPGTAGAPGPSLPAPGTLPATTQSLFLVPSESIGRFHGTGAESDVLGAISDQAFLGMPNVQGALLSIDRDAGVAAAYNAWYGDYCSPETANDVVRSINRLVDSYRNTGSGLPNLRHIVLVGSDATLPFARIPDLVTLGNESTAAADVQFENEDNPTSRAMSLGYMLSDDPYFSFQPQPWLSTELYPPSVAGGRLGETPADIVDAIARYRQFNGVLDPTTEFTTGYDFFADSAQRKETILHARYEHPRTGSTTFQSQINEAWTRANLANGLNAGPGIAAIDAHADHHRMLPAGAFHSPSVTDSDLYTTNDLTASALADGTLAFSIGCHAGLSVADVWVTGADPATLDWAQAFGDQRSLLAGNTGYGYGDTKVIAYTEKLSVALSENLDGSMSVGQAVADAKQQYYAGLGAWGVFDAKSVQQFTQYGLPMYVIGPSGQVAGPSEPASPPPITEDPDTGLQTTTLEFPNLNSGAVDTGDGVYYRGPTGLVQAEHYRPIQPITAPQDLTQPSATGLRLHGGLMLSFRVTDIDNFQAALSVPTLAPQDLGSTPTLKDATFPSAFVSTLSQDTIFGRRDSLVVFGGQFVSNPNAPGNTGTQRLFSDATVKAFYSSSDVFSVGLFSRVDATDLGNTALFEVTSPSEGIAAMYVTFRRAGSSLFESQPLTLQNGVWQTTVDTSVTKVQEYFVQMVMDTGDVSISTFKALLYPKPDPLPADPDDVVVGVTANGNAVEANEFGWFRQSPLNVSVTSRTEAFQVSLDEGPFQPSPVTVSGDGQHQVDYQGDGGTMGRAEVPIDTMAPVVSQCPGPATLLLNQDGGSRTVSVVATDPDPGPGPRQVPSGINEAGSVLSAVIDTTSAGSRSVTFLGRDFAGNATPRICSYRVVYDFEGFAAPVDNPPLVNVAKAGNVVPLKWNLSDATGAPVADPASFLNVSVVNSAGECGGPSDAIETYAGASGLQYLGNGNWVFNWKTPKAYAGQCKTLILRLADGVVPPVGEVRTAHFRFK